MPCYAGDGNRNARQTKGERRVRQHIGSEKRGGSRMRALLAAGVLSLAVAMPQPAFAQFSDSYKFLEAIRKSDADAVIKAVEQPGVTLINTKDRTTGETALHITIGRRDLRWTTYLVNHDARLDIADNMGRTPLFVAAERRFVEGAQLLLSNKANPNQANSSGETPLIRAVQLGDLEMVRLLISAGADPSRRDTIAGMSAIDYAQRSSRSQALLEVLNAGVKAPKAKGVQGPQL